MFSKSFGYALRSVMYIAYKSEVKTRVQADEIAASLGVPRFFISKVLKNLAKNGVIGSTKGPYGGFYVNEQTMSSPVYRILEITDGNSQFRACVLRFHECNLQNPCPMHTQFAAVKSNIQQLLGEITISELISGKNSDFLESIVTVKL